MKPLPQLNKLIKCFDKINENVGVNRAPVRIRHSGRAKDSGRAIFEKENLITWKNKRNKIERPRVSVRTHQSGRAGLGGRYIIKIEKDAYKLELVVEINILPTFNVKDLRPYHG